MRGEVRSLFKEEKREYRWWVLELVKWWGLYHKGILPDSRGWLYNNGLFIEAMLIIESEYNRVQVEEVERAKGGVRLTGRTREEWEREKERRWKLAME